MTVNSIQNKSSFFPRHINNANYIWLLRPSGRGILDPSLFLSLLRPFFTSEYSPKDDLVKENFFKVNHRSPSCSVTGEEEVFSFSFFSHTIFDLFISLSLYIPTARIYFLSHINFINMLFSFNFLNFLNHFMCVYVCV